ncbi:hypothetical protein [Egbenema bharatensis]|uniref:hypothetical protein n=1 Tax=Egbenema bharatensis TaxID=3463334 RepID=UPI003A83AD32
MNSDDEKGDSPSHSGAVHQGKVAAYAFSLLCAVFLAFQCVSYERKGREVPATVWMPVLVLCGVGLGVQIDPKNLVGWLK